MTCSPRIRGAVGAAVAVVLVAACSAGPAPTSGASSTAGAPVATAGAAPEDAELTWLSARAIETNDVTTAVEMALVRGDGSVPWQSTLAIDPEMPGGLVIAGPRDGVFAYGRRAGTQVVLSAVRATDGTEAEVGRVDGVVVGADLHPSTESLYVAVSGDSLRIVRLAFGGGEVDELLERPIKGRLVLTWNRLHLTPDGNVLVLEDCIAERCTWTTLRLADGEVDELQPPRAGPMVDLSNDTLLARSSECAAGPCPFLLVDLHSGRGRAWDPQAHEARLAVAEDGRTLLLHDRQGQGAVAPLTVTEPATQDELRVRPTDLSGMEVGLARVGQDSWVPAGWALLAPPGSNLGEVGGPTLMRLVDGTLRHLPAAELP